MKMKPMVAAVSLAIGGLTVMPVFVNAEGIEEVLVTARKRTESLQDIPFSVQAYTEEDIENFGINDFDDYALLTPSLSYLSTGPSSSVIYIRGASDGGDGNQFISQPTTALYLDEQPISNIGRSVDLQITDIERIEVLNGPQGTLYGASSLSGTIRVITNKPDTAAFYAGTSQEISSTENGDLSYVGDGFANIPITDDIAIRLVGWYKDEGGYIDNVFGTQTNNGITIDNAGQVQDDYNTVDTFGGRAAFKIDFNDNWSANLTGTYQKTNAQGQFGYDPTVGDLQTTRFNADGFDDRVAQGALVVEGELSGVADIIYAGSYFNRKLHDQADYTGYLNAYTSYAYYFVPFGADARLSFIEDIKWARQTHEFRASSQENGSRWNWVVGLFYDRTETDVDNLYFQANLDETNTYANPAPLTNTFWASVNSRVDQQIAAFGELTYDLTDDVAVTVGGRVFRNTFEISSFHGYGGPQTLDANEGSENDWVGKANISWQATEDILTWFTFSQGYRTGGPNRDVGAFPGYPETFESDTIDSYEIGFKSTLFNGQMQLNGAVYYLDWENTQVSVLDFSSSVLGYGVNVEDGVGILGLELDALINLSNGWIVSSGLSLIDAQLRGTLLESALDPTTVTGVNGDRVPRVPIFKFNSTLRYEFAVLDAIDGYSQFSYSYVGHTTNSYETDTRQEAYGIGNFKLGGNMDDWGAVFFVDNIFDERAEIFINPFNFDSRIETNRPRTIGFNVTKRF